MTQDYYGFTLADVEFGDGTRLSDTDPPLLDHLNDVVFEYLCDLDWDGVVAEDEHGQAALPLPGTVTPPS